MMADTGSWQVWALGKRAAGPWQAKPRGISIPKDQVALIVLFASPLSHLHELGTVDMPAQPFLAPAFLAEMPSASQFVAPAIGKRMRLGAVKSRVAGMLGVKVGAHGGVQGVKR